MPQLSPLEVDDMGLALGLEYIAVVVVDRTIALKLNINDDHSNEEDDDEQFLGYKELKITKMIFLW